MQSKRLVPVHKRSKKEQKTYHARRRKIWHEVSPVTRVVPSGKVYKRALVKQDSRKEENE
jgi:hypothetical protein